MSEQTLNKAFDVEITFRLKAVAAENAPEALRKAMFVVRQEGTEPQGQYASPSWMRSRDGEVW